MAKTYGKTPTGRVLTDDVLEQMAAEAEAGFDISKAKAIRRGPGRPPVGAEAAGTFAMRLEPALRRRLAAQAAAEDRPAAAVVREALVRYLDSMVRRLEAKPRASRSRTKKAIGIAKAPARRRAVTGAAPRKAAARKSSAQRSR